MYSCRPDKKSLDAACTPTIFMFEADGSLSLYNGVSPEKKEELIWSSKRLIQNEGVDKRFKRFGKFFKSMFKKVSEGDHHLFHLSFSQISGTR